ncbi:DNA repair protein XRCC4, C-terminal [Phytophthora cactorum]|nr:DNA repair protein XRCC4, C-terminal [Phytophthora cactorum]
MHCSRLAASSSSPAAIRVQLLDPPALYAAEVSSRHKPRALDCSASLRVSVVETEATLTFMERSEFAMKFCAIDFKSRRVATNGLEMLLEQKEKLLETALVAKQSTEDCLIQGFCAVLNAKKDEIKRLQDEVEMSEEGDWGQVERKKKEDSDESSNDENDESMGTEEEELKRAKREAVNAYRELPENLKHSSVRISSAENLLSSMDDIIKNEAEVDEATQRGDMTQMKSEPVLASQESKMESKSRLGKVTPMTTEPAAPPEPVKPTRSAPPPVDKSLDSEEEDILDMLS